MLIQIVFGFPFQGVFHGPEKRAKFDEKPNGVLLHVNLSLRPLSFEDQRAVVFPLVLHAELVPKLLGNLLYGIASTIDAFRVRARKFNVGHNDIDC